FAWARALLASLAWLARQQGDRVGFLPLGGDLSDAVPPSSRHLSLVLQSLSRTQPTGTRSPAAAIEELAHVGGRAGMLAIASDCYDEPLAIQRAIGMLRARGHDVMLFHVVDAAERDFPYEASETFADLETEARLPLEPAEVREQYRRAFAAHREEVERLVAADRASY